MRLPSGLEMDARKPSGNYPMKCWNVDLRHVHVALVSTVNSGEWLAIYDRELEVGCQRGIDATQTRPRINQSGIGHIWQDWRNTTP